MKHHRTPSPADAIREAIRLHSAEDTRVPASLVRDTATGILQLAGMAEDTAADLIERTWKAQFEITRAN